MAADMMRKINEAYEFLSDKQKRFDYDHGKDIENIQLKMYIKPIQNILITEIKKKEEHTQTQITLIIMRYITILMAKVNLIIPKNKVCLMANAILIYSYHKLLGFFPYPKIGNGYIFTISNTNWVNRIIGGNAKLSFFSFKLCR
jgi:hypothetical protein